MSSEPMDGSSGKEQFWGADVNVGSCHHGGSEVVGDSNDMVAQIRIRRLNLWEMRETQRMSSSTKQRPPVGLDVLGLATRRKRGMPTKAGSLPPRLQCELMHTTRLALLLTRHSGLALTQLKKHMSFTTYTPGRLVLASGMPKAG
ncbi:hypothetical protein ACQJBY_018204 [Aegilops geniculata]